MQTAQGGGRRYNSGRPVPLGPAVGWKGARDGWAGGEILGDFVEPLGKRILIRKDESRHQTRGGIVLPDKAEIPTITGRVVEISAQIERDIDFPIRKYDKILFHPKNAIPVDLEPDNVLFVVPIEDVVAVFRRTPAKAGKNAGTEDDVHDGTDADATE
ncbi:MAG: co-chaperone GroES [Planctomycetaceae bacterium]|nr:co-chaperone GroES [Planctomycetaceae bacterium]